MSRLEKAIAYVAPTWAASRARSRGVLAAYEAAKVTRLRISKGSNESGNGAVQMAGSRLRDQARYLDENHDLARAVLNAAVQNAIGTGIGIEPQPRIKGGNQDIHGDLQWALIKAFKRWCEAPEVTGAHDFGSMQRLMFRSMFRDGEGFGQHVLGVAPGLVHGSSVPYSVEMLEADMVPLDYAEQGFVQGVRLNAWNRPTHFSVYKIHPRDILAFTDWQTKIVSADRMMHYKLADRIGQLRGVSVFASVLERLDDVKDYETSERIAAKIAASMAAMIRKGDPGMYTPPGEGKGKDREIRMRPGMIFDDLLPGESVEMIDTNRPNTNLEAFRQGQLRAVAGGTGVTYSTIARHYDGSYSSQRQELVEAQGSYRILSDLFVSQALRPIYRNFVSAAVLQGVVKIPRNVDLESLYDALYIPPRMPWIDPKKEAEAYALLEDRAYVAGSEIVRELGKNPNDVIDAQKRWKADKKAAGIEEIPVKASNVPDTIEG